MHFHGSPCLSKTQVKAECTWKSSKWLTRWQRRLFQIQVSFGSAFPKRKIYTVGKCQFGILCSMFNVFCGCVYA